MVRTVKHRPDTAHIGTIPTNQLGSGSATSSTFLRGDQTWASPTTDHNHTTGAGDGGDLDGARVGDFLEFTEIAAPSTPASGLVRVYAKAAGTMYSKDDAGVETSMSGGGGGGGQFTTDSPRARLATGLTTVSQESGATQADLYLSGGVADITVTDGISFSPNLASPGGGSLAKLWIYGGHGVVFPPLSADPSGGDEEEAQFYYNDSTFRFRGYLNGLWGAVEMRQNTGTATVASGSTSITVTHGAGYTPAASDITITPTNSPTNDPGHWWVSAIGATTFDINVRANPGVGGATFAWRVSR